MITPGTGLGTTIFHDGLLAPHLELAQHPLRNGETYNEQLGDAACRRIGNKRWNRRVKVAVEMLYGLLMYDHLRIGGGNAAHLKLDRRHPGGIRLLGRAPPHLDRAPSTTSPSADRQTIEEVVGPGLPPLVGSIPLSFGDRAWEARLAEGDCAGGDQPAECLEPEQTCLDRRILPLQF